jgi:allophanate hydrolase
MTDLGALPVPFDFSPFRAAAELLYGGPWVAERLVATGKLLAERPDALHPVVRKILEGARDRSALAAFEGAYRLAELRRAAEATWAKTDFLLLPTTPTTFTIAEVDADPIGKNSRLGYYTNFVNLFDLAALAVPAGFRGDGLPLGVTLVGRASSDLALAEWAARFHSPDAVVGATEERVANAPLPARPRNGDLLIAVAGAHLSGQPLNHQLTSRGACLVRACRSSSNYRLYALSTTPPKPGLVFDARYSGGGIELELWSLGAAAFGAFVDEVPAPLAIGTVTLDDGTTVNGFVCEPSALDDATEITAHGGWRAYRESLARA